MKTEMYITVFPSTDIHKQARGVEEATRRVSRKLKDLLGSPRRPESVSIKIEVPDV